MKIIYTYIRLAVLVSLGAGVLEPLVIVVLGSMLNNFNSNRYFY
jgi:hypothetical protein